MLKKLKKDSIKESFDFNLIYPTTHDAIEHILSLNVLENEISKDSKIKPFSFREKSFSSMASNKSEDDYFSEMDIDGSFMSVDENMDIFTSI